MSDALAAPEYSGDLGNGLVRRWSTPADEEKIGQCLAVVFRRGPDKPLNQSVINETQVMFSPNFPLMGPGDWALVEDTTRPERPVVACLCCWSHRWSYGGIAFGVGRPEAVATLPEYRRRGLIRALFEMFHARSAARGELVQAITGIGYYYRQFGYEYALDLDGRRTISAAAVPEKKQDEVEHYTLRPATLDDVSHLLAVYEQGRKNSLVWAETTEALWRYYIAVWDEPVVRSQEPHLVGLARRMYMVVNSDGKVCGFAGTAARRRTNKIGIFDLELYAGTNWQAAMPSLLRAFCELGRQLRPTREDVEPFSEVVLALGRSHPAYEVLDEKLGARVEPPYAWYVRVADVPGFVRQIAPVLEERLASSILSGYSGELKLDLYRGGLRLQIEQGKFAAIEPWRAPDYHVDEGADLGCPPLLFLQLLFGYRSLAELRATFPDADLNSPVALLIDILFPKQRSTVWGMEYT
jgi:GNAT superfamily N-acetyltransferase